MIFGCTYLKYLNCYNNQLPFKLENNRYLNEQRKEELNYYIQCLNKFKILYWYLKFKKKFRDLLWIKIRLPKIQIKYHPKHFELLKDDDDLDIFINNL